MSKKVPQIRFKGFTNDWEQRKLLDIGDITTGMTPATKDENNYGGEFLFVSPVDIQENRYIENTKTTLTEKGFSCGRKIRSGASLFVSIGSTIGKVAQTLESITTNQQINALEPNANYDDNFVFSLLTKEAPTIRMLAATQAVPIINKSSFSEVEVLVALNKNEQVQIGAYFKNLDHLITLHQRKLNLLKNAKKSMLDKMFPKNGETKPEIRFAGFTNDWEQRKLGDTNTYFTDGNYGEAYPKASDMTDSGSGVPFLTGGNLKNGKLDLKGANYITLEKHLKLTSGHLIEDDIVIAVRGSLGALGYVNKRNSGWNINSQLAILRTEKSVLSGKYLIQFLLSETGQKQLLSKQTGSALKQLPIGAVKDISVPLTSTDEQDKIGTCFMHLDHLITLHQRKLELLKNVKKSLLEKMFI